MCAGSTPKNCKRKPALWLICCAAWTSVIGQASQFTVRLAPGCAACASAGWSMRKSKATSSHAKSSAWLALQFTWARSSRAGRSASSCKVCCTTSSEGRPMAKRRQRIPARCHAACTAAPSWASWAGSSQALGPGFASCFSPGVHTSCAQRSKGACARPARHHSTKVMLWALTEKPKQTGARRHHFAKDCCTGSPCFQICDFLFSVSII